ncbi:hypothetical protein A3A71_00885 [Candidatus Berkelbacteria bacterium RIFCSPLOWO2_01_FULL_50_28]|uniref:Uncharacterized protein n=1 Tax=Candidatus Berkelbacteria bacterium RIFCSPLOWO2_01_FULL_50_28 TaxID=1797471 RepID=A0A1F5EBF4_9BACT|nr:MAG: hypothetical protein A2807_01455 [Candidatus Berkelbacteria bacterium RIFCSPHIGHO2_01_FULL_50_36]OGD62105.1 MAG: hypothetical protein A3F39_03110 [Candidatus Berkelbacteria bacterium RIFCSPHIGHO2_12_FULL_50_11]OGD64596.1 MAG: hypothetical protein A3A71_00885 [Candidatus Berkelbacteria bacterium RIFCSPLOWO2_01_FULL_50_28]
MIVAILMFSLAFSALNFGLETAQAGYEGCGSAFPGHNNKFARMILVSQAISEAQSPTVQIVAHCLDLEGPASVECSDQIVEIKLDCTDITAAVMVNLKYYTHLASWNVQIRAFQPLVSGSSTGLEPDQRAFQLLKRE